MYVKKIIKNALEMIKLREILLLFYFRVGRHLVFLFNISCSLKQTPTSRKLKQWKMKAIPTPNLLMILQMKSYGSWKMKNRRPIVIPAMMRAWILVLNRIYHQRNLFPKTGERSSLCLIAFFFLNVSIL